MLLALDIGNTNVTIGVFEGQELCATWRIATDVERLPDEYAVIMLGLLRTESIDPSAITEAIIVHTANC